MNWDKRYLEGKLYTEGAVESAQKYLPEMRAKGADVVVAMLHGGLDGAAYSPTMENPGLHLSKVAGIDAMVMGHQHSVFPDAAATPAFTQAGVDNKAGTINGVQSVMASSWGKALGVIQLALKWDGKQWSVDKSAGKSELRNIQTGKDAAGKATYVAADPTVAPLIESQHQAAIQYVKTPIGSTDFRMSTLFADVGDPGAIQIVNQAQRDYVADYVKASLPQYAQLPVLSVSAPFKSGFQGGADYTDVAVGPLAIYNAADLYLYPNTVYAVKVNGADIKDWLEAAAKRFNQIDPAKTGEQQLISTFPGYNFDMFTTADVQYEIDVTQPVGSRIRNLQYLGKAIDPAQEFVIATNNYRATSGKSFIAKLDGSSAIWASPDANRDVVIGYVRKKGSITRAANGAAKSWRFTKVATSANVCSAPAPTRCRWRRRRAWPTSRWWPPMTARARARPSTAWICRSKFRQASNKKPRASGTGLFCLCRTGFSAQAAARTPGRWWWRGRRACHRGRPGAPRPWPAGGRSAARGLRRARAARAGSGP